VTPRIAAYARTFLAKTEFRLSRFTGYEGREAETRPDCSKEHSLCSNGWVRLCAVQDEKKPRGAPPSATEQFNAGDVTHIDSRSRDVASQDVSGVFRRAVPTQRPAQARSASTDVLTRDDEPHHDEQQRIPTNWPDGETDRTPTYGSVPPAELRTKTAAAVIVDVDDAAIDEAWMKSVLDTVREYLDMASVDRERAKRIEGIKDALAFVTELCDRDRAVAAHARAKTVLLAGTVPEERKKDHVFALGLLAEELDEAQRVASMQMHNRLLDEAKRTAGHAREALVVRLTKFLSTPSSYSVSACRRLMLDAAASQSTHVEALVFALALNAFPHRKFSLKQIGEPSGRNVRAPGRDDDHRDELVALRVQQAFGDMSENDVARAIELVRALRPR
jgi:hypothetical protein